MQDINYLKANGVDIDQSLEIFGNIETYNETIGEFLHGMDDKINKMVINKPSTLAKKLSRILKKDN